MLGIIDMIAKARLMNPINPNQKPKVKTSLLDLTTLLFDSIFES